MYRSTSGTMSYPMMRAVLLVFFVVIHVSGALGRHHVHLELVKRTSEIFNAEPDFVELENDDIAETNLVNAEKTDLWSNENFEKRQLVFINPTWNKSDIPYAFNANLADQVRPKFQEAVDYYKTNTCIRFREITSLEAQTVPHIEIKDTGRNMCSGTYGRRLLKNPLELAPRCRNRKVILHELGHTLKLGHTHARYDRDDYLKVNLENVVDNDKRNYKKHSKRLNENYGLPYDTLSIMQYPDDGGVAINKSIPVMEPRNPSYKNSMGTNFELSFIDLKMLNQFYHCSESCNNEIKCENGGFQNSNKCDECVCPSGFGGPNCGLRAGSDNPSTDCGKTLKATSEKWNTLNASFDSSCTWWIDAAKGKHVEIKFVETVLESSGKCEQAGLDVKLEDPLLTGFRICKTIAIPNVDKFVSNDNRAILRAYVNKKWPQHFVIQYRQVN